MDFSSRGLQRNTTTRPATTATGGGDQKLGGSDNKFKKPLQQFSKRPGLRWLTGILLVAGLILVIAALLGLSITPKKETSLINKDHYQVVALSDGQAYFGKIRAISGSYIELVDVYYLNNNGSAAEQKSTNVQLIKRGCEPHQPEDRMVIYRDQVNFWENLQGDGQIVKLIKEYQSNNKGKERTCNESNTTPTTQQAPQATDDQESSADASANAAQPNTDAANNNDTAANNAPATNTPEVPAP